MSVEPDQTSARTTVAGVFDHAEQAEAAAGDLLAVGYAAEDISLVMPHPDVPPQTGAEGTPEDTGALAGIAIGAIVGGAAGLLSFVLPGVGPIIAAGPIVAGLGGAAAGGTVGGLIGSLIGLGLGEEQARHVEADVRGGGLVLAVQVPDRAVAGTRQILTESGARRVLVHPEPAPDQPE